MGNIAFTFIKSANVSFGLEYICENKTFYNRNGLVYRLVQKKDCRSNIVAAPYITYQSNKVEYFIHEINGFQAKDQGR